MADTRRRYELIAPALQFPRGSRERAEAIEAVAAASGLSGRTVERRIARYDEDGLTGLQTRRRSDNGAPRVHISRLYDGTVALPGEVLAEIADKLRRKIRSAWASGAPTWPKVRYFATAELIALTRAAGFDAPPAELRRLCRVPRRLIEAERRYRQLWVKKTDAKEYADKHEPRIRRDRSSLVPMELVIADVTALDVLVCREDGSICTPRLIALQDGATNRVFYNLRIPPKGEATRQEHIAESFVAMAADPEWGMPGTVLLDNGSEFKVWNEVTAMAMQLSGLVIRAGRRPDGGAVSTGQRSAVIKARPYNAAAKPIEGWFSTFGRGFLSLLPGAIGSDRMRMKTQSVGRPTTPYPGSEEEFRRDFAALIELYHTTPQSGHLRSLSPRQAFAAHVEAGWRRTDVDPDVLAMAFAKEKVLTVRQGAIQTGGELYRHDELLNLTGGKVTVRVPLFGDKSRLPVILGDDRVVFAEREPRFAILDPAGSKRQRQLARTQSRRLAEMRRETDRLDLVAEVRALVALEPPAPQPQSAGVIQLDKVSEALGRAKRALGPPTRRATTTLNAGAALWLADGNRLRKSGGGGGPPPPRRSGV